MKRKYVHFEETGEVRYILRACKICQEGSFKEDITDDPGVVSVAGVAHEGADYGMTWCGRDATGPRWWWRI